MSLFCCSYKAQIPAAAQATRPLNCPVQISSLRIQRRRPFVVPTSRNTQLLGHQQNAHMGSRVGVRWSFAGGSRIAFEPEIARISSYQRNGSTVSACWLTTSQIASNAFTLGTVAVLPFYTLMVVAPNAQLTKRAMESIIPYVALGVLYAYLLYLSWSPDTLRLLFASKYWLPELPGIARMFSNKMTAASAWIHLLVVDLFAARHVFHDGIKNKIETRHSVSLCLFFCPIGIVTHAITKVLTRTKDGRSD